MAKPSKLRSFNLEKYSGYRNFRTAKDALFVNNVTTLIFLEKPHFERLQLRWHFFSHCRIFMTLRIDTAGEKKQRLFRKLKALLF